MKPHTAIIFYMGFSEKDDGVLNGTTRLSIKAHERWADKRVTVYYARTWKSDPKALIAQIKNLGIQQIIIVGYSWGFGCAAIRAARHAESYGLKVLLMFSIDGVFRLPLPTWMGPNPLMIGSLCKNKTIEIPSHVLRVAGVYQRLSIPQGHPCIKAPLSATRIDPFTKLSYSHTIIDDADECHEIVLKEIEHTLQS